MIIEVVKFCYLNNCNNNNNKKLLKITIIANYCGIDINKEIYGAQERSSLMISFQYYTRIELTQEQSSLSYYYSLGFKYKGAEIFYDSIIIILSPKIALFNQKEHYLSFNTQERSSLMSKNICQKLHYSIRKYII